MIKVLKLLKTTSRIITKDEIGIVERGVITSSMNNQLLCDEKNIMW